MNVLSFKIIGNYCCSGGVSLGLAMARMAIAQTTIPVDQWGAMQTVVAAYQQPQLYYPFTGSATLPLSVTCQFQPSSYSPGSYEPGYVSPGWIELRTANGQMDGIAIFEINKPLEASWSLGYTSVLIGNNGRPASSSGPYIPGGAYTIHFTFNRAAATIQIDVTGPTSYTNTVSSSGQSITGLWFLGPAWPPMGSSLFGNVSVEAPTPAAPPALVLGGWQTLGVTNVLSLTWSNNGAAYLLESSGALTGGWSTVSTPWATNGNWVGTQVTNDSPAQFFRLRGL